MDNEGQEVDPDEFPEFDSEEFYAKFDDENPPLDIPEEVTEDVDNDFNMVIPDEPDQE